MLKRRRFERAVGEIVLRRCSFGAAEPGAPEARENAREKERATGVRCFSYCFCGRAPGG